MRHTPFSSLTHPNKHEFKICRKKERKKKKMKQPHKGENPMFVISPLLQINSTEMTETDRQRVKKRKRGENTGIM